MSNHITFAVTSSYHLFTKEFCCWTLLAIMSSFRWLYGRFHNLAGTSCLPNPNPSILATQLNYTVSQSWASQFTVRFNRLYLQKSIDHKPHQTVTHCGRTACSWIVLGFYCIRFVLIDLKISFFAENDFLAECFQAISQEAYDTTFGLLASATVWTKSYIRVEPNLTSKFALFCKYRIAAKAWDWHSWILSNTCTIRNIIFSRMTWTSTHVRLYTSCRHGFLEFMHYTAIFSSDDFAYRKKSRSVPKLLMKKHAFP